MAAIPDVAPAVAPQRRWYVTTEKGEQFGPVPKSEVDAWVAEGLLTARAQVCQEGDPQWRWASDVFPVLVESNSQLSENSSPKDDFGVDTSSNPYQSQYARRSVSHRARQSSDTPGTVSLIFGCTSAVMFILGFLTCGITWFAVVPLSAIGLILGFFGQGNLKVAGITINLLLLLPATILAMLFIIGTMGQAALPPVR